MVREETRQIAAPSRVLIAYLFSFLRPVKGYKPPPDVEKQVLDICATVLNRTSTEGLILRTHQLTSDPVSRFKVLFVRLLFYKRTDHNEFTVFSVYNPLADLVQLHQSV